MRLRGCLWLAKIQLLKSPVLETTEVPPCLLPFPGLQQLSVKWHLAGSSLVARALHSQLRIQLFHQALHNSGCFHIAHVRLPNCVNSNVLINHKQPFLNHHQLVDVSKGGSLEAACQPVCHFGQGTHALTEALPSALSFSSLGLPDMWLVWWWKLWSALQHNSIAVPCAPLHAQASLPPAQGGSKQIHYDYSTMLIDRPEIY